jgi:hypothetical protein
MHCNCLDRKLRARKQAAAAAAAAADDDDDEEQPRCVGCIYVGYQKKTGLWKLTTFTESTCSLPLRKPVFKSNRHKSVSERKRRQAGISSKTSAKLLLASLSSDPTNRLLKTMKDVVEYFRDEKQLFCSP